MYLGAWYYDPIYLIYVAAYRDGKKIFTLQISESGRELKREGSEMNLFNDIKPSMFVEVTALDYKHKVKGCVGGHNIKLHKDKSVEECSDICDANPACLAFEYGVAYGGGGKYKARDCQEQSSKNYAGCDGAYHNLDLYIKP